jgi:hypothetical protein
LNSENRIERSETGCDRPDAVRFSPRQSDRRGQTITVSTTLSQAPWLQRAVPDRARGRDFARFTRATYPSLTIHNKLQKLAENEMSALVEKKGTPPDKRSEPWEVSHGIAFWVADRASSE